MSEATPIMKLLDEAQDALRGIITTGIRNSTALVDRCGELADELSGADLRATAGQLRAVAEAEDDRARVSAVFHALAAVRHTRLRLAGPALAGSCRGAPRGTES
ncbi:MAG: hypothetical protein PVH68_18730 [Armatimonadota bacterium]|jgi:hypothetical protein